MAHHEANQDGTLMMVLTKTHATASGAARKQVRAHMGEGARTVDDLTMQEGVSEIVAPHRALPA